MKNRRKMRKRGFTLTETLIVVGIIVIITALAMIPVSKYQRKMYQLEADGIAKEIYVAAQEHLSAAFAQNYLSYNLNAEGAIGVNEKLFLTDGAHLDLSPDIDISEDKGIYFFAVDEDNAAALLDGDTSLLSLMLPIGSVDDTIRRGGSYVIRYQKDTGCVLDVFYANADGGKYGHSFEEEDYPFLLSEEYYGDSAEAKNNRRNYRKDKDNAVIGYYGGREGQLLSGALISPVIQVINGESLKVQMSNFSANPDDTKYKLVVSGLKSGNSVEIRDLMAAAGGFRYYAGDEDIPSFEEAVVDKWDDGCTFILDDITSRLHFANQFGSSLIPDGKKLIPGENIEVYVIAYNDEGMEAESARIQTNSLFASCSGGEAGIGFFRHLENLDSDISGFEPSAANIDTAVQQNDLSWKDAASVLFHDSAVRITYPSGTSLDDAAEKTYVPVKLTDMNYDGAGYRIADVVIDYNGNAGLFGVITNAVSGTEYKIHDITLVNFNVTSSAEEDCTAGALAGIVTGNTKIYNVLSYTLKTLDQQIQNELAITACGTDAYAGGLIGAMDSGSVVRCAAASYVVAEKGTAGGLIGAVAGTAVTDSYSGGHTYGARYQRDLSVEGKLIQGHPNVRGKVCGGFVGAASDGAEIAYCYSTCSVFGTTAGGFAGALEECIVADCYETGMVAEGGTTNGTFYAEKTGDTVFKGRNFYLSNVSVDITPSDITETVAGEEIPRIIGVSGKDTLSANGKYLFINTEEPITIEGEELVRAPAYEYDNTLIVEYKGEFYFLTIDQMHKVYDTGADPIRYSTKNDGEIRDGSGNHKSVSGMTDIHYGDFQVPSLEALPFEFYNDDRLYIDIDIAALKEKMGDDHTTFTLALTGVMEDGTNKTWLFEFAIGADDTISFIKECEVTPGTDEIWKTASTPLVLGKTTKQMEDPENPGTMIPHDYYTITLDDITRADGHFADIFKDIGWVPGTSVTAQLSVGQAAWREIKDTQKVTRNSLFAEGTTKTTAAISNARHLQNLDPLISGVSDSITAAELRTHVGWGSFYQNSYMYPLKAEGSAKCNDKGKFFGIYNKNLTSFNGKNYRLEGFSFYAGGVLDSNKTTESLIDDTFGAKSAGLFRYVSNELTVKNLELLDCKALAAGGHAGTVAAEVAAGGSLTIDTVLVHDSDSDKNEWSNHIYVESVGNYSAGGLVGSASGMVNINNCGVSVYVTAGGSGNAGGLVGESLDTVVIVDSFVGGRTEGGKYYNIDTALNEANKNSANWWNNKDGTTTANAKRWNISQTGSGAAGGLVGYCKGDAKIAGTFNAASVWGFYAGGLIGRIYSSTDVYFAEKSGVSGKTGSVYTVAPVSEGQSGKVGAAIGYNSGSLIGENVYYLKQIDKYYGTDNETKMLPAVGTGAGSFEVKNAFYDKDIEDIEDGLDSLLIAAKYDESGFWTMQVGTQTYDSSLNTKEYPYSIRTSLPFGKFAALTTYTDSANGTYFGDWQPIEIKDSGKIYKITFKYDDPLTGEDEVDLSGKELGLQNLLVGVKSQEFLTPSMPYYPGWEITTKEVNGTPSIAWEFSEDVQYTYTNGKLCILNYDKEKDLTATAQYTKTDEGICSVRFFYKADGSDYASTTKWTQIGSPKLVEKDTAWSSFMAGKPVTARTVNDYRFIGWYKDEACTQPWNNTDEIDKDVCAYAKYEKLEFFTITIDFLYEIETEGGDISEGGDITGIPRYSVEDQAQFRIVQPCGEPYNASVTLPSLDLNPTKTRIVIDKDLAVVGGKEIANTGESGKYEAQVSNNKCNIYAEDDAHFQVIYTIPAAQAKVNVGYYRLIYKFGDTADKKNGAVFKAENEWDTFDGGHTKIEYPNGENVYIPLKLQEDSDGEVKAVIPTVEFPTMKYYTCKTTQESLNKAGLTISKDPVDNGDGTKVYYYDLIVEFERKEGKINFATAGGTPIGTIKKKIGQTVSAEDIESKTTTRDGYSFGGWGKPYIKGHAEDYPALADNSITGWSFHMPAVEIDGTLCTNVEFKASWIRDNVPYTVIIWREKVTVDRETTDAYKKAHISECYDFVSSSVRNSSIGTMVGITNEDTGYTGTGDYAGYHYNSAISDKDKVVIASDGTLVLNVFYDRNIVTMTFPNYYRYTPTQSEMDKGGTYLGNGSYDTKFYGKNSSGQRVELRYDDDGWYYIEYVSKTREIKRTDTGLTVLYQTSGDSTTETLYTSDNVALWYTRVWKNSKWVYTWYRTDNNKEYKDTKYKEVTPDSITGKNTSYYVLSGNIITGYTVDNDEVLRREGGKYYKYTIEHYTEPVRNTSQPVTNKYQGLYGQALSKYGYAWPTPDNGNDAGDLFDPSFLKYDGTVYYDNPGDRWSSPSNNPLTYLGEFTVSEKNVVDLKFTMNTTYASSTKTKIYFIKQQVRADGTTFYPEYTDSIVEVGNFIDRAGFNLSNKFDGYQVVQWKYVSETGDWHNQTSGSIPDGSVKSGALMVRFERKPYPLVVNIGYITPNDGIIFPAMKTKVGDTIYIVAKDNSGTQYGENGARIYWNNSAWRTENSWNGNKYQGTYRYKQFTEKTLNAGAEYWTLDGNVMSKHTVSEGRQIVKENNAYYLKTVGIDPEDFKKETSRLFDTNVDLSTILSLGIDSTMSIGGANYTWNNKIYVDDECRVGFKENQVDKVPSATLQYFILYTPPTQKVTLEPALPAGAKAGAVVTWKSPDVVDIETTSYWTNGNHTLSVLQGFNLDGCITDENGDYRACFTPVCEGYIFDGWALTKNATEEDFYSSMVIDRDYTLYPVWTKDTSIPDEQWETVWVYHVDEYGNSILPTEGVPLGMQGIDSVTGQLLDHEVYNLECGKSHTFESLYFDEYYPKQSIITEFISYYVESTGHEPMKITFTYKQVTTWKYSVEYRVGFRTFEDTTEFKKLSGYVASDPGIDTVLGGLVEKGAGINYITVGDILVKPAYSQYQSVVFELPEGYGAYNLDHIEFIKNDETGNEVKKTVNDNSYVVIDRGDEEHPFDVGNGKTVDAKVIFYLEPDPTAISVGDRYMIYNGNRASNVPMDIDQGTYKAPNGYSISIFDIYAFVDADGKYIKNTNVVEAGSYKMNGFLVMELKNQSNAADVKYYLMYQDVSRTLNLRISPRNITMISTTATKETAGGTPLVRSRYEVPMTGYVKADDAKRTSLLKEYPQIENFSGCSVWYNPDSDILFVAPDDGYAPIIADDVTLDVHFSVEAFRMSKGETLNSFTYEPVYASGKAKDYQFSTAFGTLKIGE